jgi:hypothetical protein
MRADAELVNFPERKFGYYSGVQIAVNGVVCVPFDVPAAYRDNFRDENAWIEYLIRQAVALIGIYGDARTPKDFSQFAEAN